MDEKKFGNILTMVLIILVVIIVAILGYFGYSQYSKNKAKASSDTALQDFEQKVKKVKKKSDDTGDTADTANGDPFAMLNPAESNKPTQAREKSYMEKYEIIGTIKIPKIKLEYPVLEKVTKRSLEISVCKFDGPGLNQIGNTTIMGHNYRNGLFFSNNHKLANGDDILITDETGTTITYEIYNMYYTDPSDAEYMRRDTNGKREISLSTCNDDSSQRLVIWAVEKEGQVQE